jgi:hypothetical protein
MKPQNLKFAVGEVVVATQGAYSDYSIVGYFVTIKEFDMRPLAAEYAAIRRAAEEYEENDGFIGWLVSKELVVPVNYREIYLGEYSRFSKDFEVPQKD